MYYSQNCPKCNKQHIEIEKLKNQMRTLISLLSRVDKGTATPNEIKRVLSNIDGEKRLYYEAE